MVFICSYLVLIFFFSTCLLATFVYTLDKSPFKYVTYNSRIFLFLLLNCKCFFYIFWIEAPYQLYDFAKVFSGAVGWLSVS